MFAPIVRQGQRSHRVYLPQGQWIFTRTGETYSGGAWYEIPAEIHQFIAFVKEGAQVLSAFTEE